MNARRFTLLVALTVLGLLLAACGGGEGETVEVTRVVEVEVTRVVEVAGEAGPAEAVTFAGGGDTLGTEQERGVVKCGTGAGTSPGFATIEDDGSWTGFNHEFCRAVAAATLGDADAVENVVTTAVSRFPILQSGEADLLSNNTTWTLSRDTSLGFDFAPTWFYDGQGMMVRSDSGIETIADLDGGSVCVATGTTTEKNLADVFRQLDIDYEAVVFDDTGDTTRSAFEEGRCDGYTTDTSALLSQSTLFADPSSVKVLPDVMSKEPLGPLVRHGDDNWFDIVKWSVNCMIQSEELGITSANVDDMLGSDDPVVLNTLGQEGDLGQAMGLNNDWCYQIISQVGNYGEAFDRHLGPGTVFDLSRGVNDIWLRGGLLYSPPFR